jgi:hypothetical protein
MGVVSSGGRDLEGIRNCRGLMQGHLPSQGSDVTQRRRAHTNSQGLEPQLLFL